MVNDAKKIYVLELVGDIRSTPGTVTLETEAVSVDRAKLEALKVLKEEELDAYFADEDENEHITYLGYDLDGLPDWVISEVPLV